MIPILEGLQDLKFDSVINEAKKKTWYVSGVTMIAERKNGNGRIYPKNVLSGAINEHMKKMSLGGCVGELKHPTNGDMNIDLDRVSHKFIEVTENGNEYFTKAKICKNTDCGKKVIALLEEDIQLGMSSRAVGNLNHKSDAIWVTKLHILSFGDIVHNPSVPGAFLDGIFEGQEWVYHNGVVTEKQVDHYKKIIESASRADKKTAMTRAFRKYFKDLMG
jgi:hypothetical protein